MTAMLIGAFVLIFYAFILHCIFVSLQGRIIPKKMFAKSSKPLELKNSKKCKYKVILGFTKFLVSTTVYGYINSLLLYMLKIFGSHV